MMGLRFHLLIAAKGNNYRTNSGAALTLASLFGEPMNWLKE